MKGIAAAGGVFKVTGGLLGESGPVRVRDTPICGQAVTGSAMGAAMSGWEPAAEIMCAGFAGVCSGQIASQLPEHSFRTGVQVPMPVTIRLASGAGPGCAGHIPRRWGTGSPASRA